MSGYGGQPPSGWQDPYGQDPYGQHPYGQNPYGQNPYRQNPYGQQQGWQDPYGAPGMPGMPGGPEMPPGPPASNAAAVGAIVGNCLGLVFVCGVGIAWLPGLILGGMAVGRIESDPAAARSLTRASWICCVANFVIEAVIFVAIYLANQ